MRALAALYGGDCLKSIRIMHKAIGKSSGYNGQFRAFQGFKYVGDSTKYA